MELIHHGGFGGVTGSCHQLRCADGASLLVDCGLFQGEDARRRSSLHVVVPVHGERPAKEALGRKLRELGVDVR